MSLRERFTKTITKREAPLQLGLVEALIGPSQKWRGDALRNMQFRAQRLKLPKLPQGPIRSGLRRFLAPRKPKPRTRRTTSRKPRKRRRPRDIIVEI